MLRCSNGLKLRKTKFSVKIFLGRKATKAQWNDWMQWMLVPQLHLEGVVQQKGQV